MIKFDTQEIFAILGKFCATLGSMQRSGKIEKITLDHTKIQYFRIQILKNKLKKIFE